MSKQPATTVLERAPSFLSDLLSTLTVRGRALMRGRFNSADSSAVSHAELLELTETLLSRRGEATGIALAQTLLKGFAAASRADRLAFLTSLAETFGPDRTRVERAVASIQTDGFSEDAINALHDAAEPRRQELFRRLNHAPGGTAALMRMREALLDGIKQQPGLRQVDRDFVHLFASWFNRGFLVLRRIDWNSPASILEKIIRYEAVHAIENWDDLRNRLAPPDRRCYGFFHPQLADEPLIFVEVALTKDIPNAIAPLLELDRTPIAPTEASTAVFYSISNTQRGLGGISFGNFLIKQVVEDIKRELPNLKTFVTLSPVPNFAGWLAQQRAAEASTFLDAADRETLQLLDDPAWPDNADAAARLRAVMLPLAASFFLEAKNPRGRPVDAVARFHLGNGARLEQLDFLGDRSEKGLQQSHGLMVNYLYALDEIENNHEAFAETGFVTASPAIRKIARSRSRAGDTATSVQ